MKPYIFRIHNFNDNSVNQFNVIANNPTIQPRAKVSIFTIILLCGLLCLLVIGYVIFGKNFVTSEESIIGYIALMLLSPLWGSVLAFLVLYNIIASCSHKPTVAIISMFINLIVGCILLSIIPIEIMPNVVTFVCALIVWGIAYSFYLGTKNRMKSVSKNDAGPYSALIIDNNKDQLLLENLNINQLCCIDDFCEELKKLSKEKL